MASLQNVGKPKTSEPGALSVVNLQPYMDVYMIILRPSGVMYEAQTGGVACMHPQEEGVLVTFNDDPPLDAPETCLSARLGRVLLNARWLDESLADAVDTELGASWFTRGARVDRARLLDSHEAWVYVLVEDGEAAGIGALTPCGGVLTWANSD